MPDDVVSKYIMFVSIIITYILVESRKSMSLNFTFLKHSLSYEENSPLHRL